MNKSTINKTIVISAASLLLAGVAFATWNNKYGPQYADVTKASPITEKQNMYGEVIAVDPITQSVSGTKQVCNDVTVEKRAPERYGNKDGTVVGAVVGGLIGSQIGGGDGKKVAAVAGAVGGGFAGREIDERHVGGKKYTTTERVCHNEATNGNKTVGYDVQYRTEDGQTLSRRENKKPGNSLLLGTKDVVIGYDVTWSNDDKTGKLFMEEDPGTRLPIKDGVILVAAKSSQDTKQ